MLTQEERKAASTQRQTKPMKITQLFYPFRIHGVGILFFFVFFLKGGISDLIMGGQRNSKGLHRF